MKKFVLLPFFALLSFIPSKAETNYIWMGIYLGVDEEPGCCTINCAPDNEKGCYTETDDNGNLGNVYIYDDFSAPTGGTAPTNGPTPGHYITVRTLDGHTQNVINTYQGYFAGMTIAENADGSNTSVIQFQ